jgi:predicted AAA+ superfamily ATPase
MRQSLPDYVALALRGGFPEVVYRDRSESGRRTWLDSYLDQLLTRDALFVDPGRDTHKMRSYFETIALNTAGQPADATLYRVAGINAKTAAAYDRLFSDLFLAEHVPAWATNRLSRLVHTPKRYIVDPALAATSAGLTARAVLADGDLLGRMLDTFATAQLRPEVALSSERRRMYHLRTKQGRQEVDLIVELDGGSVLGIEFKSGAAISTNDARHLVWLRDQLGDRFVAGAVMHTGPDVFVLDERILAVPLCAMWG